MEGFVKVDVPVDERVGPARVISADDIPWFEFDDPSGWIDPGAMIKRLSDARCDLLVELFFFPPGYSAPAHWHENDTVYIIRKGVFRVEGEGEYRPGDVRWVKGGTAYAAEQAGPEGCEVWLISSGVAGLHNPAVDPPPNGWTHEAPA